MRAHLAPSDTLRAVWTCCAPLQCFHAVLTLPSARLPAAGSHSAHSVAVAITQGGAIQLANNGTDGVQGLQTLTMSNAAAAQPGTTILQYAQTTDGQQILVPSNQVVVQGECGWKGCTLLKYLQIKLQNRGACS